MKSYFAPLFKKVEKVEKYKKMKVVLLYFFKSI